MVCSDVVLDRESYFGMALHRACLDAAEARWLAKYGSPGVGPTCQDCGRPVGVRDYPAVYPWDSDCACVSGADPVPVVDPCPVCGERHEIRICTVTDKSLIYQPCKTCGDIHPFYPCEMQQRPALAKQPAKPQRTPKARPRIAQPHAG
jgi:hypothetical protein